MWNFPEPPRTQEGSKHDLCTTVSWYLPLPVLDRDSTFRQNNCLLNDLLASQKDRIYPMKIIFLYTSF